MVKKKSKKRKYKKNKKKSSKILMNGAPIFETFRSPKRKELLDKCGIPDVYETSHCFADHTHHTCCELGPEARRYADRSGNPIGKLSEDVFEKLPDDHPKKQYFKDNGRRPWCTCFGSKVCGYYGQKFKDTNDTNIKFISSPFENKYAENVPNKQACEEYVRTVFDTVDHGTPGIRNISDKCEINNIAGIKYDKI